MSTAAAAALLAGTIGVAAQVPAEKQQSAPSATKTLPDAGAPKRTEQAPTGAQSGSGSSQGSAAERTKPAEQDTGIKSVQGEKPSGDQQKSTTQTNEKSPPSSASQPKDAKDTKDSAQSRDGDKQRAGDRTRDRDNQRAGERDRDNQRASDRDRERDAQRAGSRDRDQDGQRAGARERDSDRRDGDRAGDDAGRKGERVQFSERERTTIRDSVDIERARVNVDIDVNVGAAVPRSVNLRPLPTAIIDLNPRYRNYRYVVVQNEIVIINPQTYTVVEVIPAGGSTQARATTRRGGSVQLDTRQRQRILSYAREECQSVLTTDPDFELAVGIRIPERIELCPFEDVVVSEVGVVRPYRFFVVRDQVVLVDPADHTIVEVIR